MCLGTAYRRDEVVPPEREVLPLLLLLPPDNPPERLVVEPLERKFEEELLLRWVDVVPRLMLLLLLVELLERKLLDEEPLFTAPELRVGCLDTPVDTPRPLFIPVEVEPVRLLCVVEPFRVPLRLLPP